MEFDFITEELPLGDVNAGMADQWGKDHDKKPSEALFIRKGVVAEIKRTEDEERASVELITTGDKDRDGDIIRTAGADVSHFRKNPQVLFAHNYMAPPIGKAAWVKRSNDPKGLLAKTVYAATAFAEEIWLLVRDGFLPARSIGFIPTEWFEPDEKQRKKDPELAEVERVFTKWELLEYSVVPVPSNRQALQMAMRKGLALSDNTVSVLGLDKGRTVWSPNPAVTASELDGDVVVRRMDGTPSEGPPVQRIGPLVKRLGKEGEKPLDTARDVVRMAQDELDRRRGRI